MQNGLALGLALCLLSVTIGVTASSPGQRSVAEAYRQAVMQVNSNDYRGAITVLQAIISDHPHLEQTYKLAVDLYIFMGELQEGESYFRSLLTASPSNSLAHYGLARIQFRQQKYPEALAGLKNVIKLNPDYAPAYGYREGLPEVYRALKRLDDGVSFFQSEIARDARNAFAHLGLARCLIRKYDWDSASSELRKSLRLKPDLLLAWHASVHIQWRQSKYSRVIQTADSLAALATERKDYEMLAYANMMLGNAHLRLGDYSTALSFLQSSLGNARRCGDLQRKAACLNTIAATYAMMGSYDRSQTYFREALMLAQQSGSAKLETRALLNIGSAYRDDGKFAQASSHFEKALHQSKSHGLKIVECHALTNLAEISSLQRDDVAATNCYTMALSIARRIADRGLEAYILRGLGSHMYQSGHYATALTYFSEARAIGQSIDDAQIVWEANSGLGACYAKQNALPSAIHHFEEAVRLYDEVRNSLTLEFLSDNFLDSKHEVHPPLVRLLAESGNKEKAFHYAEKYKAKSLLDILLQRQILLADMLPDTTRNLLKNLSQQIEELRNGKETGEPGIPEDEIAGGVRLRKAAELQLQWAQEIRRISQAHGNYLQLTNPDIVDSDFLQNSILKPHQALVEYVVGTESISAFVITPDSLFYTEIHTSRAELHQMLRNLSPVYDQGKARTDMLLNSLAVDLKVRPAFRIYETLVKPLQPYFAGKSHLIIVPDDWLHHLPFELLVSDTSRIETDYDFANVPFLIEDFTISYVPAATLLNPELHSLKEPVKGLLAVGNPTFVQEPGPPLTRAAVFGGALAAAGATNLLEAEREVNSIAGIIDSPSTTVLTGADATEASFKARAADYQVIHLATHFVNNDKEPLYSAIPLSPPVAGVEDGSLQTYEIFNLTLNADLAVLSSCSSGAGKIHRGEGLMGLYRAFLYANTPSLVLSSWAVEDNSTSAVMQSFYKYLKQGNNKAEALRKAKLDFLNAASPTGKDPYYWAPFVLVGNWQPIDFSRTERVNPILWILSILAVVGLLTTIFRMKKLAYSR